MAHTGSSSMVGIAHHIKFNYSNIKGIGVGKFVFSPTFTSCDHEWRIVCFPEGSREEDYGYVSLYLQLLCKSKESNAIFKLYLLDKHGKASSTTLKKCNLELDKFKPGCLKGHKNFIKRTDLEANYIDTGGFFIVVCMINLEGESCKQLPKKHWFSEISAFDVHEDFSKLLEKGEMSDVTFQVEEETFAAHKVILAARSPVFKAELFGSMSESGSQTRPIVIKDMQPDVFKAMLHFIYTDSFPELSDEKASVLLVQHLIVAADRYGIERLKLISEEMLCEGITLDTVVSTIAIADRHCCTRLKHSCLEFIAAPKNLLRLMLDKEYVSLIHGSTSLLSEIEAKTRHNSSFKEITQT